MKGVGHPWYVIEVGGEVAGGGNVRPVLVTLRCTSGRGVSLTVIQQGCEVGMQKPLGAVSLGICCALHDLDSWAGGRKAMNEEKASPKWSRRSKLDSSGSNALACNVHMLSVCSQWLASAA